MRPSLRWLWRVAPRIAVVHCIADTMHACRLHSLAAWWANCRAAQWAHITSMPPDGVTLVHYDVAADELSWLSGWPVVKWSRHQRGRSND